MTQSQFNGKAVKKLLKSSTLLLLENIPTTIQDSARPHVTLVIRQNFLQLGWDMLPRPPYSPDIVPSDFYLCRSFQNNLIGKNLKFGRHKKHRNVFFA